MPAFQRDNPPIDVAIHEGQSGKDEREGFHAIFRGVMLGVRDPRAHELFAAKDPQQALEYLGLASLPHRRLDAAEGSGVLTAATDGFDRAGVGLRILGERGGLWPSDSGSHLRALPKHR